MSTATPPKGKKGKKNRLSKTSNKSAEQGDFAMSLDDDAGLPTDIHGDRFGSDRPSALSHKITMVFVVIVPFIGLIAAIVLAFQYAMISPFFLGMLFVGWMATGMGITVGFHRMLTHRSFDTYNWVRLAWAALGSLAVEGPPLAWVAVHRKHHQHSDHDGDPHSPHLHGDGFINAVKGCWHSHIGWLFGSNWDQETIDKYAQDLKKIKGMEAISRQYVWWVVGSLAFPAILGGLWTMTWTGVLMGLLWGGLARVFLTHHVTWSINSICHIFGSRDYHSGDDSRNNVVFGILSHGEGWHNNHHAFPTSARHGLKWWQFDSSWIAIKLMSYVGLVWNIRLPSEKAKEAKLRT